MRRFVLPLFVGIVGFSVGWVCAQPAGAPRPRTAPRPEFGGIGSIRVEWSDPADAGKRQSRLLGVYHTFPHEAKEPPTREVRAGDWVIHLHPDEKGESQPVASYLASPVP